MATQTPIIDRSSTGYTNIVLPLLCFSLYCCLCYRVYGG